MAEASDAVGVGGWQPKKGTFLKFSFRGVDLDQLLDLATDELRKKQDAPPGEKPEPVRAHLQSMIIVPEMIASIIDVYNGKTFSQLGIKSSPSHISLLSMEGLVLVPPTHPGTSP